MTNDLIKRQDAIHEIVEMLAAAAPSLMPKDLWCELVVERISKLSSAQQWIPCSERLPDEARHYLCSFKKPNRIDRIYVDLAYWTGGRWYGYMADAINAWMPLPAPYKGE